jgi:hypothetical protein
MALSPASPLRLNNCLCTYKYPREADFCQGGSNDEEIQHIPSLFVAFYGIKITRDPLDNCAAYPILTSTTIVRVHTIIY